MHNWKESDDIVAFYLYRSDDKRLLNKALMVLRIEPNAMEMRMANFRHLDGHGGLSNPSAQSQNVFEIYQGLSKPDLKLMVEGILMRAEDR